MGNLLCRHCFHLFPEREGRALCSGRRCARVSDEQGRAGRRFLVPRQEPGLWSALRRRPDLAAACPYCQETGRLVPACPYCRRELPRSDGADDRIIAVLGAKDAGKSHYLATLFHQFLKQRVGGEDWRVEADEETLVEIERRYWRPLFEERRELPESPLQPGPEMRLLLENQHDGRRVLLAFRDLSGENFTSAERIERVDYLRYAHGVVLLADPQTFGAPPRRGRTTKAGRQEPASPHPDFLEVLERYRAALDAQPRTGGREAELLPLLPEQKLLAVAVSKADLVLPKSHGFWRPEAVNGHLAERYWERRAAASEEARRWLVERLGARVENATRGFADVSWFFVSNFGYKHQPHSQALERPPQPLRVHEPIFALLDRFGATTPARRGTGAAAADQPEELSEL
ncbi:MAG TPA: hypothetical protein VM617_08585 [Thermoanaerobaculia bacterium]|nr:hypothetical protein [Thermoanaerobaculia bacterium]